MQYKKPNEFAKKVVQLFGERRGVFENRVNVEDWVPQELDKAGKSNFIFYVTQLDYATKSTNLYQGAVNAVSRYPNFFTAEWLLSKNNEELKNLLEENLHPRYVNEALKRYTLNSQRLLDEYQGNSINIFTSSDAEKIIKKVYSFRGFGPKTGNLFFRAVVNTFDLKLQNLEEILQPVDIHDVRIAFLLGYLDSSEMTNKNIQRTKMLWKKACNKAGVNWLTFDRALWILGSEGKPKSREAILSLLNQS